MRTHTKGMHTSISAADGMFVMGRRDGRRRWQRIVAAAAMTATAIVVPTVSDAALPENAGRLVTVDFEGSNFVNGSIAHAVFAEENGVTAGDPLLAGAIRVIARDPRGGKGNRATIIDASCLGPPDCDWTLADLYNPQQGNILFVSESADGDDGPVNGIIENPREKTALPRSILLDFDHPDLTPFGDLGLVSVASFKIFDNEDPGSRALGYLGDELVAEAELPTTADGGVATAEIDFPSVDRIVIAMTGSGAIDDIELALFDCVAPPGDGLAVTNAYAAQITHPSINGGAPLVIPDPAFQASWDSTVQGYGTDNPPPLSTPIDLPAIGDIDLGEIGLFNASGRATVNNISAAAGSTGELIDLSLLHSATGGTGTSVLNLAALSAKTSARATSFGAEGRTFDSRIGAASSPGGFITPALLGLGIGFNTPVVIPGVGTLTIYERNVADIDTATTNGVFAEVNMLHLTIDDTGLIPEISGLAGLDLIIGHSDSTAVYDAVPCFPDYEVSGFANALVTNLPILPTLVSAGPLPPDGGADFQQILGLTTDPLEIIPVISTIAGSEIGVGRVETTGGFDGLVASARSQAEIAGVNLLDPDGVGAGGGVLNATLIRAETSSNETITDVALRTSTAGSSARTILLDAMLQITTLPAPLPSPPPIDICATFAFAIDPITGGCLPDANFVIPIVDLGGLVTARVILNYQNNGSGDPFVPLMGACTDGDEECTVEAIRFEVTSTLPQLDQIISIAQAHSDAHLPEFAS